MLYGEDGALTERGAAYMSKLDALTGVRYQRLRKGLWVSAEGIIYESYDPAVHLIDKFRIPWEWPRVWSVDFGYTNPFVCQMWAEDPDGRLYLYREIYRTRKTVDQHAKDIMDAVSQPVHTYVHPSGEDRYAHHGRVWGEPQPRAIVCDHDAENREVLARELGIGTTNAHKSVTDGIEAVMMRMALAGDGRPRIYLMRDAVVSRDQELVDAKLPTCTAEEIVGYIWAPPTNGRAPKEEPVKKDDHGCDALRYRVAESDLAARPRIRSM